MAPTDTATACDCDPEIDRPSFDEKARFFIEETAKDVGYEDVLDTGLGRSGCKHPEGFIRNLEFEIRRGVEQMLGNKRDHGYSPIKAWEIVMEGAKDYPEWFKQDVAESQHIHFDNDPDNMSDEEREYVDFLEAEFGVPV